MFYKSGIAAALLLVLSTGLAFANEDIRESVAMKLESFNYSIGQTLGLDNGDQDYSLNQRPIDQVDTYRVDQVKDFNGIGIKVTDLVLDEHSLQFNYLIESDKIHGNIAELNKKSSAYYFPAYEDGITIKINDEEVAIELGDGIYEIISDGLQSNLETYKFDNRMDLKNTNKVEIIFNKLQYDDLAYGEDEIVEGNISFVLEDSLDNMSAGSLSLAQEVNIETEYGDFVIDQVKLHDYDPCILISTSGRDGQDFDFPDGRFLAAFIILDYGSKIPFSNFSGHLYDEENDKARFNLKFDGLISETEIIDYPRKSIENSQSYMVQLQVEDMLTRDRIDIASPVEIDLQ